MRPAQKGRRRNPRLRVYYQAGDHFRSGDLVYEGGQPVLVVRWRTLGRRRVPEVAAPLNPGRLKPLEHRPLEYVYRGKPPLPEAP